AARFAARGEDDERRRAGTGSGSGGLRRLRLERGRQHGEHHDGKAGVPDATAAAAATAARMKSGLHVILPRISAQSMFAHAEYQALHDTAAVLDRTARGRLQLTGADRLAYLHGLL